MYISFSTELASYLRELSGNTPGGVNINILNGVVNLVISDSLTGAVQWVSSPPSKTTFTG